MIKQFSGAEGILRGTELLLDDPTVDLVVVDGLEQAAVCIQDSQPLDYPLLHNSQLNDLLGLERWEQLVNDRLTDLGIYAEEEMSAEFLSDGIMPHIDFSLANQSFIGPVTGSLAWRGKPGRYYVQRLPENGLEIYNEPEFFERYDIHKQTGYLATKQAMKFIRNAETTLHHVGTMVLFANFPAVAIHAVIAPPDRHRGTMIVAPDVDIAPSAVNESSRLVVV